MVCGSCGARASLAEWAAASGPGAMRGKVGVPPAGTKIRVSTDARGGKVWEIPASRKPNFFIFFSVIWLAITTLVSGGFLFSVLSGGEIDGDMPQWVLIPFLGIFWAVGVGLFYLGLRQMLARHTIMVGAESLIWRRDFFGRITEKSLLRGGITTIAERVFYRQNNRPVYGIEIKGMEGRIRFGTTLRDEEKAWLVAELTEAAIPKKPTPKYGGAVVGGLLEPMKVGGAAQTEIFSHMIPGMGAQGFWIGLVFALVGGGFASLAFTVMDRESWIGFRGIWALLSSIFMFVGLGIFGQSLLGRGKERRIEGNASDISVRTYRRGLILKDESFPRRDVTDIRASLSGNSGSTPMKRLELIVGDRAVKLASWIDGDEADALVRQVREALGR